MSQFDKSAATEAGSGRSAKLRSVRPLDPKWQALHALLKSYLKQHADTKGKVRKELRDALFKEVDTRLRELTRIIAAKHQSRGITPLSDALSLRVWRRKGSFTDMMLGYEADDARQGFNWFYTIVLNVARDMHRSRSVETVYASELVKDAIEDEVAEQLIENLGAIDDAALSTEQKVELSFFYDRLKKLPPEMQRIAEHVFANTEDLTQAECAESIGISLATFKRRKNNIEQYLQGKSTLESLL